MGSTFTKQKINIYIYKIASFKCNDQNINIIPIEDLNQAFSNCQNIYKILIPFNYLIQYQQKIIKAHHKVILIKCGFYQEKLLVNKFLYIQTQYIHQIKQNHTLLFKNDPSKIKQLHLKQNFNHQLFQQCPIALIFNQMHYLAVRHCKKALHYYSIKSIFYQHPLQFIDSKCQTKQIICGLKQLEYIFDKLAVNRYHIKQNTYINVFCKIENYNKTAILKKLGAEKKINIQFSDNFLAIVEEILQRNSIPSTQNKTYIENLFILLNGRSGITHHQISKIKKLQKNIKNVKFRKLQFSRDLPVKIKKSPFNLLIIDKSIKNFVQISNILQKNGLSDCVFILRKNHEINDEFKERIKKLTKGTSHIGLKKSLKKAIVIGSQEFLFSVFYEFSCLDVKLFIRNNEYQKIIDVFCRQNQIIIVQPEIMKIVDQNTTISSIIYIFHPQSQKLKNQILQRLDNVQYISNQRDMFTIMNQNNKLPYTMSYPFQQKRISYISQHLSVLFSRQIKQNLVTKDNNQLIAFFACQAWIFDQITNVLIQVLTSKYTGNFILKPVFFKIKCKLTKEIIMLHEIYVIQENAIENILQIQEQNPYQYCQKFMVIFCKSSRFKKVVNQIWCQLLHQRKMQHLLFTPHLFFIIFLSFSKMQKIHQIASGKILLKIDSCEFGTHNIQKQQFLNKIKKYYKNYIYSYQFLYCSQTSDRLSYYESIFIQIQAQELTSFKPFFNFYKFGKNYIIQPLTKFKVSSNLNNVKLTLESKYQQKFMRKFSHRYLQFEAQIPQLITENETASGIILYMKLMENKKYISAYSVIRSLVKLSNNQIQKQIIQGYKVITLLKMRFIRQAQKNLKKQNPFYRSLIQYIKHLKDKIFEQDLSYKNQQCLKNPISQKKKWQVNYIPHLQKFGLIQKQNESMYQTYDQQNIQIMYTSKERQKTFIQTKASFEQFHQNNQILDSYQLKAQNQNDQQVPKLFIFAPNQTINNSSLISEGEFTNQFSQNSQNLQEKSLQKSLPQSTYQTNFPRKSSSKKMLQLFNNSVTPLNNNKNQTNSSNNSKNNFANKLNTFLFKNFNKEINISKLSKKQKISRRLNNQNMRIAQQSENSNLTIIKQINDEPSSLGNIQQIQKSKFDIKNDKNQIGKKLFRVVCSQFQNKWEDNIDQSLTN